MYSAIKDSQDTNWFGKRSEKVNISSGSGLLDLNQTPVNELVYNHHQCFVKDLNFPRTQEKEMSSVKNSLDDVHGKDISTASPASCCTAEREDSSQVMEMAAECLLHISTVSLDQSQDNVSLKLGSRPNSSSQDQEPSCSYDSFELHTLGISETIPEDVCCVSSSKGKDEFNNKKEVGVVKVRRGRRMKNFQKEILPGLLSLSRHEIREDMNILETVLRSSEYKKIDHGKSKDGKCKPSQRSNKDSTKRYLGRRRRGTE